MILTSKTKPLPTIFISHGGGPWPWMDWGPKNPFEPLAKYLRSLPESLSAKPKAILMISAHWEEEDFTVMTNPRPSMLYDYQGFPEHTYQVQYDAPGSPELAKRVQELLSSVGIHSKEDAKRGFDHGVFAPLAVSHPNADIPVVQLSLKTGYDPEEHLAVGRALMPLRSEGVLIIGSGLSYHNLRGMRGKTVTADSMAFDAWLTGAVCTQDARERNQKLLHWDQAPAARSAHPEEDHLIPLMVVAGAGGNDQGIKVFSDQTSLGDGFQAFEVSGFQFG